MGFESWGMTEEEIARQKRRNKEFAEKMKREDEEFKRMLRDNHRKHIAEMERIREKWHREFLRYIQGRSY